MLITTAAKVAATLAMQQQKAALDIDVARRTARPVPTFVDRLIYDEESLQAPTTRDIDNWRQVATQMHAARPQQLDTARVYTGNVDPGKLINRIDALRPQDSFFETISDYRNQVANEIAALPRAAMAQTAAGYYPLANAVVQNIRSPGVLIHELGHAVDLAPRKNESNTYRFLRWKVKPRLLEEYDAWRKGRQAYQQGYAASVKDKEQSNSADFAQLHGDYLSNMRDYNKQKYPAFGTYVGASVGGLGGLAAGGLGGAMLAKMIADSSGKFPIGLPIAAAAIGSSLGGAAGVPVGGLLGKGWEYFRRTANENKAKRQLQLLLRQPGGLEKIQEKLQELQRENSKKGKKDSKMTDKKKNEGEKLRKAANAREKEKYLQGDAPSGALSRVQRFGESAASGSSRQANTTEIGLIAKLAAAGLLEKTSSVSYEKRAFAPLLRLAAAAARGLKAAPGAVATQARRYGPGVLADTAVGGGLTALDYGLIPGLKNPLLGAEQVEIMRNAPWDEKALSLLVNTLAGAGMRRSPGGWKALTVPAGLLTSPAINLTRKLTSSAVTGGDVGEGLMDNLQRLDRRFVWLLGDTNKLKADGTLVNPGALGRGVDYLDRQLSTIGTAASNTAASLGAIGGGGIGGALANYFATEPVAGTDDPETSKQKQYNNRIVTGLGALVGAGLGGVAASRLIPKIGT